MRKLPENLDLKQHLREWYRHFIPIMALVSAVILIIWIFYRPAGERSGKTAATKISRIGLLAINKESIFDPAFATLSPIEMVSAPKAVRFDVPLGSEHGALVYNAQPFLTDKHLGDDLNGVGGWDSDLGDSVYAVADGLVLFAGWPSDGWGNVVVLLHELPDGRLIETFYGHLKNIKVPVGKQLRRGEVLGTVGTANGRYLAHLHFEIRRYPDLDIGAGYADSALGRLPGERSLLKWRGRADDLLSGPPVRQTSNENSSLEIESGKNSLSSLFPFKPVLWIQLICFSSCSF